MDAQLENTASQMPVGEESRVELSIVMPCLNEAETLKTCIMKARRALREHRIAGEIIVADNGSQDGSQAIAASTGVRIVHVQAKGYGSALMGGIAAARGKYVIMGDADDSYDPFADYSEFDAAQEEEEDINFFRNGRFVTLGLLLGYRGWTENLARLQSSGLNYGVFLSYFFDLRFAVQFSFTTGDHTFQVTSSDGVHRGNVGIQNFGLDLKYYLNTQNITKG